jgi:hypothetical protein
VGLFCKLFLYHHYIIFLSYLFVLKWIGAKKNEINLSFEPKMRGIEVNNVTYYIEKDMQTVSAYENGKIKWQTNIISVCGKPGVGKPEVRCLKIKGKILQVVFGKHSFANVNINNGKTKFIGSD